MVYSFCFLKKKGFTSPPVCYKSFTSPMGLEPTTFELGVQRAIPLRHGDSRAEIVALHSAAFYAFKISA